MKLKLIIFSGLCVVLGISCGGKKTGYQEIIRPVRVIKVQALGAMQKMYTGIVEAEEFISLVIREKCNENLKIEIRLRQG